MSSHLYSLNNKTTAASDVLWVGFFLYKQDIGQRVLVYLYKQILASELKQAFSVPTAVGSLLSR